MHAARLEKSERLQRVLAVLRDGRPHSTRSIVRKAGVCAVNSCVAELRANALEISGEWGTDPLGRRAFYYTLMGNPQNA